MRKFLAFLAFLPPVALLSIGAVSAVHAANPTGSCTGFYQERQDGQPQNANWTKTSHSCDTQGTCPPKANYQGVCQEIMTTMFPDGSARFTCGCKYTWIGQGEPPDGKYVIVETGTVCDSWVDRQADTGAFINAFCQGDCPSPTTCQRDTNIPDESPHGTTRDVTCECKQQS